MLHAEMELLVFATHKDPGQGWKRAQRLIEALEGHRVAAHRINRQAGTEDALALVVRFGVLSSPTTLLTHTTDGVVRVLSRWDRIPATHEVIKTVQSILLASGEKGG